MSAAPDIAQLVIDELNRAYRRHLHAVRVEKKRKQAELDRVISSMNRISLYLEQHDKPIRKNI